MLKPVVISHAPCPDGFCASWVARQGITSLPGETGDVADFHPAAYKTDPPDVRGRDVYVLDYCYPPPVMRDLVASAASCCVLDHHADKLPILRDLSRQFGAQPGKFSYTFDVRHSGAYLAWEHFFPDTPVPALIRYVEDRDLWRNDGQGELPCSRELNAVVSMAPYTFEAYDALEYKLGLAERRMLRGVADDDPTIAQGRTILAYQESLLADLLVNAHDMTFDGADVRVVNCNCSKLVSEAAARLAVGRPFGVAWFYRGWDRKIQVSLRAAPGGVDVSVVARRHGGGGHVAAAGFEIDADCPLNAILVRK